MQQEVTHFLGLPALENSYCPMTWICNCTLPHVYINQDRLLYYDNKLFLNLSTRVDFFFVLFVHQKVATVLNYSQSQADRVTSKWNFASSHVRQEKNMAGLPLPHKASAQKWHASLIVMAQASQMALFEFKRVWIYNPPQARLLIMNRTIHYSMLKITAYSKR